MKKHCASKTAYANSVYAVLLPVPEAYRRIRGREKVRFLSTHARRALALSARKSGVVVESLKKEKNGAPIPSKGVYWSLTHKETFVGAVAAPEPVGIDMERIRSRTDALLMRITDDRERGWVKGDPTHWFFRYWTAKEAVLKAAGKGLSGLSSCRIDAVLDEYRLAVTCGERRWEVEHHFFNGHVASLTCGRFNIVWVVAEEAMP